MHRLGKQGYTSSEEKAVTASFCSEAKPQFSQCITLHLATCSEAELTL